MEISSLSAAPAGENGVGRYIYGVAEPAAPLELGGIGINGSRVYTLVFRDICAIVHDCPPRAYQSGDAALVGGWVQTHHFVLERARASLETVLPMRFDTIIAPDNGACPGGAIENWLRQDYEQLKTALAKIAGMDEYAVRVSYDPAVLGSLLAAEIPGTALPEDAKNEGLAYLRRLKLERKLRAETERLAGELFRDFLGRIERYCGGVVVEKPKKHTGSMVMLLNLSCLVSPANIDSLGEELDRINQTEGFSVHFSGPWLPYSFTGEPGMAGA